MSNVPVVCQPLAHICDIFILENGAHGYRVAPRGTLWRVIGAEEPAESPEAKRQYPRNWFRYASLQLNPTSATLAQCMLGSRCSLLSACNVCICRKGPSRVMRKMSAFAVEVRAASVAHADNTYRICCAVLRLCWSIF